MKKILLRHCNIVNEGVVCRGDIFVEGEFIKEIVLDGRDCAYGADYMSDWQVVDLDGLYVFPGVIDTHVHFREPGAVHKGCIASESAAAAMGGVTSFIDMPNNAPPATTIDAVTEKFRIAESDSVVNYSFYLGASNDNLDEIIKVDASVIPAVKVFLGSSTGNMLMDDADALDRLFRASPVPVMAHCEDNYMIKTATEAAVARYGKDIPFFEHPVIRSREACIASTGFAIEHALKNNARLHIAHLSTADEVSMLSEARVRSDRITGETCVQYLWFDDSDYARFGPFVKCNPAIKRISDKEALQKAVRDGLLNVSTDHAPHLFAEKQRPYLESSSGIPLVQYSLLMMLELSKKGVFPIECIASAMCHEPALLFDIEKRGFIRKGYFADFAILDLSRESSVAPASRCGWSPIREFSSTVLHTMSNGEFVVKDGMLTGNRSCKALSFRR